jgi:hypothetical protein
MSGDLVVNTNTWLTNGQANDTVYLWDVTLSPPNYDAADVYTTKHHWNSGASDPTTATLTQGFWYDVAGATSETWVQNFSINP